MAVVQPNRVFVGYSTLNTNSKISQFADIELVNRDLIVAFYTLPGERLMLSSYGCEIWNMLFEPFTSGLEEQIIAECERIVGTDSRLQLLSTNVTTFELGIQVQMNLLYIPYNVVNSFSLSFDQATAQALM